MMETELETAVETAEINEYDEASECGASEICDGESIESEMPESEEPGAEECLDDGQTSEALLDSLNERRLLLEAEIAGLETELERRREETDRIAREYAEFRQLYPDVNPDELAEEVLESMASGIPMCAAYALYEKRQAVKNAAAAAHNRATRQSGFGSVGRGSEGEYYTPDEVRAMTRIEIKQNYQKILRSMEKWH